jgi:hypothetical protein
MADHSPGKQKARDELPQWFGLVFIDLGSSENEVYCAGLKSQDAFAVKRNLSPTERRQAMG